MAGVICMNDVVLPGVDNLLQLAIGSHIIGAEREALKGNIKICIANRDHTIPGIIIIVLQCFFHFTNQTEVGICSLIIRSDSDTSSYQPTYSTPETSPKPAI